MSKQATIAAVLDANVLYSAPLIDYLLYLAGLEVYNPLWTDAIQEEWIRSLLKSRPDVSKASLEGKIPEKSAVAYRESVGEPKALWFAKKR